MATRPLLSDIPLWEEFGARALMVVQNGGADLGECVSTMARIGAGDAGAWHSEWAATADRIAAIGESAFARGHHVSARQAWLRASTYYRVSYSPLYGKPVDPRLVAAFDKESVCFAKTIGLADHPEVLVEVPYAGTTLPGLLATVDDSGAPRPTMIHTNGYDSNIVEMYLGFVEPAIRRGYNVLLFDGPGQGRNLIRDNMVMRPDWEHVVTPVIDYALTRPEIDPQRMVLTGWSLGGYLAPRAAAFEHRLAALIADPGAWDMSDNLVRMTGLTPEQITALPNVDPSALAPLEQALNDPHANPMLHWKLIQRGMWVNGADSLADLLAKMAEFELSPYAANITCPTLITAAEDDPLAASAGKLYDAITAPKTLVTFTSAEGAGDHCEAMARSLYNQRVFDWLDETLSRAS